MSLLLRVVLLAYPRQFRSEYGTEWARTIADMRVYGELSAPRLAGRVIIDALATAPRMRWETLMAPAKTTLTVIVSAIALVALMIGSEAIAVLVVALAAIVAIQARRHDQPIASEVKDWGNRWYLWVAAAAVLFVVGVGALAVVGDGETASGAEDTSVVNGLAWLAWMLSWVGAAISAAMGVFLGAQRVRHRRQPA